MFCFVLKHLKIVDYYIYSNIYLIFDILLYLHFRGGLLRGYYTGPEKLAVEAHGLLIGFLLAKREPSARVGALLDLNPPMVTHVL